MTNIVPFQAWHLTWLEDHGIGEQYFHRMTPDVVRAMGVNAVSAIVDGDVIACGGAIQFWPGRWQLWALLSLTRSGSHMTAITYAARRFVSTLQGRIEFTVRKDFDKGHRWARALGFKVETPLLVHFGPEGEDHVGYVKVQ